PPFGLGPTGRALRPRGGRTEAAAGGSTPPTPTPRPGARLGAVGPSAHPPPRTTEVVAPGAAPGSLDAAPRPRAAARITARRPPRPADRGAGTSVPRATSARRVALAPSTSRLPSSEGYGSRWTGASPNASRSPSTSWQNHASRPGSASLTTTTSAGSNSGLR